MSNASLSLWPSATDSATLPTCITGPVQLCSSPGRLRRLEIIGPGSDAAIYSAIQSAAPACAPTATATAHSSPCLPTGNTLWELARELHKQSSPAIAQMMAARSSSTRSSQAPDSTVGHSQQTNIPGARAMETDKAGMHASSAASPWPPASGGIAGLLGRIARQAEGSSLSAGHPTSVTTAAGRGGTEPFPLPQPADCGEAADGMGITSGLHAGQAAQRRQPDAAAGFDSWHANEAPRVAQPPYQWPAASGLRLRGAGAAQQQWAWPEGCAVGVWAVDPRLQEWAWGSSGQCAGQGAAASQPSPVSGAQAGDQAQLLSALRAWPDSGMAKFF